MDKSKANEQSTGQYGQTTAWYQHWMRSFRSVEWDFLNLFIVRWESQLSTHAVFQKQRALPLYTILQPASTQ